MEEMKMVAQADGTPPPVSSSQAVSAISVADPGGGTGGTCPPLSVSQLAKT